jgi:hypothetical protein
MKNALSRNTSGKGLIRSMDRRGSRSDMSPPVTRKLQFRDPSICDRCGAVYSARTWRRPRRLAEGLTERATWVHCPGCAQAEAGEHHGRVMIELHPERQHPRSSDDLAKTRASDRTRDRQSLRREAALFMGF